ncbi:hypothetical protein GCM10020331_033060 [Ectobacillus funiculus]
MATLKTVGRIGGKTLLYFEIITTLALIIGMLVANVTNPGKGMNIDPSTLTTTEIEAKKPKVQNSRVKPSFFT